jgi:hypothetical protein
MSTIQDVPAERLAKLFHHYQEALAHGCNGHGGEQTQSSWERASEQERKLMVAAARLAILELATATERSLSDRKYYAKPGEADWGC